MIAYWGCNFTKNKLYQEHWLYIFKKGFKTLPTTSYEYTYIHLDKSSLLEKENSSYSWHLVHIQI